MVILFISIYILIIQINYFHAYKYRPRDIIDIYPEADGNSQYLLMDPDNLLFPDQVNATEQISVILKELMEKETFPFVLVISEVNEDYSTKLTFNDFIEELSFLVTPYNETHRNVICIGILYSDENLLSVSLGSKIEEQINEKDLDSLIHEGTTILQRKLLSDAILEILDLTIHYIDNSSFEKILLVVRIVLYLILSFLICVVIIFIVLNIYYKKCFLSKEEQNILAKMKQMFITFEYDKTIWKKHCLICLNKFEQQSNTETDNKSPEKNLETPNKNINKEMVDLEADYKNSENKELNKNNKDKINSNSPDSTSEASKLENKNCLKAKCNHMYHRECLMKMRQFCSNECLICDVLFDPSINHLQFRDNIIFMQKLLNPKFQRLKFSGYGEKFKWSFDFFWKGSKRNQENFQIQKCISISCSGSQCEE